jgi:trk system potassium uptake protein TrkH
MNRRSVQRVLGVLLASIGVFILPAAGFAFADRTSDLFPLLLSAGISLAVGLALLAGTRGKVDLTVKDGFAIVTFGWLACAVFGALPFLISGAIRSPVDAFFESMSGFTTTGSTILTDIEALPRGLLFWRSLTHWLGGMGIVVLSVAVLPALGVGGMQLFRAEVPGPTADRLSPRIQNTAKILWGVYVGLSAIEAGLLMFGGMSFFDALCHTFGTMATGGFSTRNASVGAFPSPFIQTVITVFMFLAGANFALHYWLLRRRFTHYWKDEEFRFYAVITVSAIALLWADLVFRLGEAPLHGLQLASFQAVSILTTTGFGTADFLLWGAAAQILLLLLMFIGGCAGSTGGGMKNMRVLLLGKHGHREIRRLIHRQAVFTVRLSGRRVSDEVMMNVLGFFLLYVLIFAVATLTVSAMGVDLTTSLGAAAATLGNIGPGLGEVGPASTYAALPAAAKAVLAGCMLLGRLELFTVLVVLTPMFWRRT